MRAAPRRANSGGWGRSSGHARRPDRPTPTPRPAPPVSCRRSVGSTPPRRATRQGAYANAPRSYGPARCCRASAAGRRRRASRGEDDPQHRVAAGVVVGLDHPSAVAGSRSRPRRRGRAANHPAMLQPTSSRARRGSGSPSRVPPRSGRRCGPVRPQVGGSLVVVQPESSNSAIAILVLTAIASGVARPRSGRGRRARRRAGRSGPPARRG